MREGISRLFSGRRESQREKVLSARDYIEQINTILQETQSDGYYGELIYNSSRPESGTDTLTLTDGSTVTITMQPSFDGNRSRTNPILFISLIMSGPIERALRGLDLDVVCEVMTSYHGTRSDGDSFRQENNVREITIELTDRGRIESSIMQVYHDADGKTLTPKPRVVDTKICTLLEGSTGDTDHIVALNSVIMGS